MSLLFAALLSGAIGLFVVRYTEDPRLRVAFLGLASSCAILALGLWTEMHVPAKATFAARVNMTAALAAASLGLYSGHLLTGLALPRLWRWVIGTAVALNVATVWLSDLYFSGEMIRYEWGHYVGANPYFALNPLLGAAIGTYAVVAMAIDAGQAPAVERNRRLYVATSYGLLSLALLDYLPHFGIDLFGGSVSAVALPAFLTLFGYACLRFRLMGFGRALGAFSARALVVALAVAAWLLVEDLRLRAGLAEGELSSLPSALAAIGTYAVLGPTLPEMFERWIRADERAAQVALRNAAEALHAELDEARLWRIATEACREVLGAHHAAQVPAIASPTGGLWDLAESRRDGGPVPEALAPYECAVPIAAGGAPLGLLVIAPREEGKLYTPELLQLFRTLGRHLSSALAAARSAAELEKRHSLDRFLPPQLVDQVLEGSEISGRHRREITVFFSDLKDFSTLADHMDAEDLATVLDEYLAVMAACAFRHGGTVDKFMGDGMMVLFGAPVELDPSRQVAAAFAMGRDMHAELMRCNTSWLERGLLEAPLRCRMGVHLGAATVGSFGDTTRADYTAIGRTVNLASRLESAATAGAMLLSEAAWEMLEPKPAASGPRAIRVKGFSEAVMVVEVSLADGGSAVAGTDSGGSPQATTALGHERHLDAAEAVGRDGHDVPGLQEVVRPS